MLSELFWELFSSTGRVGAYLLYRQSQASGDEEVAPAAAATEEDTAPEPQWAEAEIASVDA